MMKNAEEKEDLERFYECTIVMYHYVRELKGSRYSKIKGLDLALFRQQIDFLKSRYTFISTEDLMSGNLLENSILLTFDDGYSDHYTNVFPILKENNIQGFFSMPAKILAERKLLDVNKIHFILATADIDILLEDVFLKLNFYRGKEFDYPVNEELFSELAIANRFDNKKVVFIKRLLQNYLEETLRNRIVDALFLTYINLSEDAFAKELYMSYDQVKLMQKEGMYFGIHGYDHHWLDKLSDQAMQSDISKALDFYQGIIDKKNWVMCYPYGSYNEDTLDFISKNGCKLGFTTEVSVADLKKNHKLCLPRLDTNDFYPVRND